MAVDSLVELKSAFDDWRKAREHVRIPVPPDLIRRALRAAAVHGPAAVRGATKIPSRHLAANRLEKRPSGERSSAKVRAVPAFSRVELSPSAPIGSSPLVEVETPSGAKLRVFTATPELLGLVAGWCGAGGRA